MSGQSISGVRTWLIQRISAIYMLLFLGYLFISLQMLPQLDYLSWHDWVNQSLTKSLLGVFVLAVLVHAWIGLRDVFLDYLKPFGLRFLALISGALFLLTLGFWAFGILFSTGVV